MNQSDFWFLMETAVLEIAVLEKKSIADLKIVQSKVNKKTFYIIDKVLKNENGKPKIWFKKTF